MRIILFLLLIFAAVKTAVAAEAPNAVFSAEVGKLKRSFFTIMDDKVVGFHKDDLINSSKAVNRLFDAAIVMQLRNGLMVYSPLNGVVFIALLGNGAPVYYLLGPSDMASLTGMAFNNDPKVSLAELLLADMPDIVARTYELLVEKSHDDIRQLIRSSDVSYRMYRDEVLIMMGSPLIQDQINGACLFKMSKEQRRSVDKSVDKDLKFLGFKDTSPDNVVFKGMLGMQPAREDTAFMMFTFRSNPNVYMFLPAYNGGSACAFGEPTFKALLQKGS